MYRNEKICYNTCMNIQHDKEQLTKQLLDWYKQNARVLPWREKATPYRVWVSEIMLQQTRVEAVKPYFERFIATIPDIPTLANTEDEVLAKLWEGLGYYRRVYNMKKCAQVCVEKHGGKLPNTYAELLELPGIGAYTAGAIASIAFGECVAAVDGNVLRVFSRVLVLEDDILKESVKRQYAKIVQTYIPKHESSAFNQALMELGATICVPNAAPRCNICPIADNCKGYQCGKAHYLPNKAAKKTRRIEKKTICVLRYKDKFHVRQRASQGLLAGLYEFDWLEGYQSKKAVSEYYKMYVVKNIRKLPDAKHIFSHIEWHMKGYLVEVEMPCEEGVWCTLEELKASYAIPTAYKAYKDALEKE